MSRYKASQIFITIFATILPFFVIVLLYLPGLSGPFFLDDLQTLEPAQLNHFSIEKLIEISLQNDTGPLGRPLSVATFALNSYFWGSAPFSYKVVNLFLHGLAGIAAGLCIYLLMLLRPKSRRSAFWIAYFTALLWLIHPLQLSTVLYPVQRMTQLASFFILMGINVYLLGRLRLITQQSMGLLLIFLAYLLFFPLALLSKETGFLLPWYILCIEFFLLKFHCQNNQQKILLRRFTLTISVSLVLGFLGYFYFHLAKFLTMYTEKGYSIFERLLTETKATVLYLKLILFPRLADMGLYHDDFPLSHQWDLGSISSMVILLSCALIIIVFKRKQPIIAFGLAWFFISGLIESTIIPLELVFEHRNYLSALGILLIPIYYFITTLKTAKPYIKRLLAITFILVVSLLMGLTFSRSIAWSSPENFLIDESTFHPKSPRVHIEIANWLLAAKQYQRAMDELDQAEILQPHNTGIILHKILVHCVTDAVPALLYQSAIDKIKVNPITPYVIMVLDKMVENIFTQKCSPVDDKQIRKILQAAYENPYLWYKPLYFAVLLHLEAGLALSEHQVVESQNLLLKSFQAYPKRIDPLIQKAYIELQYGQIKQAKETLDLIHTQQHFLRSPKDKIAKLDKIIHALQPRDSSSGVLKE